MMLKNLLSEVRPFNAEASIFKSISELAKKLEYIELDIERIAESGNEKLPIKFKNSSLLFYSILKFNLLF